MPSKPVVTTGLKSKNIFLKEQVVAGATILTMASTHPYKYGE
jgi:hypothetical protein